MPVSNWARPLFASLGRWFRNALQVPSGKRAPNRSRLQLEDLEGRVVPAGWDWAPVGASNDGTAAGNYVQAGTENNPVHGVPAVGDTVIFSDFFNLGGKRVNTN